MGKMPFRVQDTTPRDNLGRFAERYRQPPPPEIIRKSTAEGTEVLTLLSRTENQAPDHDNAGGRAGAPENPWGPAKPATSRPPMRVR